MVRSKKLVNQTTKSGMKCTFPFPLYSPITLSLILVENVNYRFGLATGGAYAEYIATPASMIVRKPDHVSWVQAAAVMENWLTAFQGTVFLSVPPDPQKHQTHV